MIPSCGFTVTLPYILKLKKNHPLLTYNNNPDQVEA